MNEVIFETIKLTKEELAVEKSLEKDDYVRDQNFQTRKKLITDATLNRT